MIEHALVFIYSNEDYRYCTLDRVSSTEVLCYQWKEKNDLEEDVEERTDNSTSVSVAKGREDQQMIKVQSPDVSKSVAATENVQEKCNERWQEQQNPPCLTPTKTPLKGRFVCAQPCLTLCHPMDSSPPGSSVHGIFQAVLSKPAFLTPGNLPDPGIEPESLTSPALAGGFVTTVTPGEAQNASQRY